MPSSPHRVRPSTGVRTIAITFLAGLAALLAFAACDNGTVTEPQSGAQGASARVASSSASPHRALARYLALSLNRPNVRNGLFNAMRQSPVYEGKLLLSHAINGNGIATALLNAMAKAGGISKDSIRRLVETAPQMEVYLPVEEHRDMWEGDDTPIVATSLTETGAPYGVDSDGNEVELSADSPPSRPTIALVQAESFTPDGAPKGHMLHRTGGSVESLVTCGPQALQNCGGGTGGYGVCEPAPDGPDARGIGIRERTFCLRHLNSHEPWHKGKPEFFLLLAGTEDTDSFAEMHPRRDIPPNTWDDVEETEWTEAGINLFDLDTDMGNRVAIQCFEEDSGDNDNFTLSGTTEFPIGPVNFSFNFENIDLTGDEDDNCGSYELLLRTSTGEFTTFRQSKSLPDGTNELEWLSRGIDLTT